MTGPAVIPPTPAAPAAPAAPAPVAAPAAPPVAPISGPIVTTPTGTIARSAIEEASARARAAVDAGGTNVVEATPTPAAPPVAAPPAGQPPVAGDPAVPVAPVVPPVEGAPTATGEGDEPPIEDEEGLSVILPGRNDEQWEFVAPDAESAERLRQLRNGYMRGEEVRAAHADIQSRVEELEQREIVADLTPTAYIRERLKDAPELVDHLILSLLTDEAVYARLAPVIAKVNDENGRREIRLKERETALDLTEQLTTAADERKVVRENLQDVQSAVATVLPANMPAAQQRVMYEDCIRDLKAHADRFRLLTIPLHDVPTILANRLLAYGVNPVEAATAIAEASKRAATRGARTPAAKPAGARGTPPAAPPARVPPTPPNGKRFVVNATKKVDAGAIPPAGAGSPSSTGLVPPVRADGTKMGIDETIAARRQQLAAQRGGGR